MNLYFELRRLSKLAEARNPMYEKSRFAKFWIYLMVTFWIGYLIFFGSLFAFIGEDASVESYHIINAGLIIFLALDFLIRLMVQKPPSQEMKPYILLPVKRERILDCLMVGSALNSFNTFWLCFFLPFSILCVARFYGFTGVVTYNLGIWLLMVANNYWYIICRTLMSERFLWFLLPLFFYIAVGCGLFIPDDSLLFDWSVSIGEGYIRSNPLTFFGTLAIIALLYLLCRSLVSHTIYNEMNRVEDTTVKVKTVSEYRFFNRFGLVGEYMKLELKLMLRNKICRNSLYSVGAVVLMFSSLIAFTDVYTGGMKDFLVMYNFIIFSLFLLSIMGYEGNYMDGLMSRKESILQLLTAKYYIYSVGQLIPFILLIPAMITGEVKVLTAITWPIFASGFVYFCIFQMAIYNSVTINLTQKLNQRNPGTGMQNLISMLAMGVPTLLYFSLKALFGETVTDWVLISIGLCFIASHQWWIANVYNRLMKRKYKNMEGFRDSRQK